MNHAELLDKLEKQKPYVATQGTAYNNISALLAVVELHKPFQFEDGEDSYKPVCQHCQLGVVGDIYPCETIQIIEKELQ